jgi:hypothetical protein
MSRLRIKQDRHVQIGVDDSPKIIPTQITLEFIHSLRGKYKGHKLLEALMAEKQTEKDR